MTYYIIPTTNSGNMAADTCSTLPLAIELAKQLYEEYKDLLDVSLDVIVWPGDENGPHYHLDYCYSVKSNLDELC